jgi:hypothetical protein
MEYRTLGAIHAGNGNQDCAEVEEVRVVPHVIIILQLFLLIAALITFIYNILTPNQPLIVCPFQSPIFAQFDPVLFS